MTNTQPTDDREKELGALVWRAAVCISMLDQFATATHMWLDESKVDPDQWLETVRGFHSEYELLEELWRESHAPTRKEGGA